MSYNVNRNVSDAFYRYKMPKLIAKVEGKGNGIKTVIVNMVDVAKALSRPPTYPTKYFGCELGAQTQFDFKNDRYIVNGSHESIKLQNMLDGFIKKFVLCPECENPETTLFPNEKKGIIKQTCKACGHSGILDVKNKLTTFILKNPPDANPDQQGNSLTKKKERGKDKKGGAKGSSIAEKNGHSKLQPGSSQSPNAANKSDNSDNDVNGEPDIPEEEDDDWIMDVSEEAVKQRLNSLAAGVKCLAVSDDLEKSSSQRLEIFYEYCKTKKESGVLHAGVDISVFKDIAAEADRLEVKEGKAVMVIVELLFDDTIVKQIELYRGLLLLFTFNQAKSQKYLLGAIEKLIELNMSLMAKVPIIFKALYDCDIVDEEVFLEWGKKASKKHVAKETATAIQAKALPFLKWLQEAEEESSETDEDDVEIEYDDRVKDTLKDQEAANVAVAAASTGPAIAQLDSAHQDEEEGSDIDIDDI